MNIIKDIPRIYSEDIFSTKIFSCLSCLIPFISSQFILSYPFISIHFCI